MSIKSISKMISPKFLWEFAKFVDDPIDDMHMFSFLSNNHLGMSFAERLSILFKFYSISANVNCQHTESEMLTIVEALLKIPPDLKGSVIEAGTYKGGSAAKFSLFIKKMNRKLLIFDSFEGIPENEEFMENGELYHPEGIWKGALEEVKSNIRKYGNYDVCEFHRGWFEQSLPEFNGEAVLVYLDVDLASSTKTCLKYLYPKLQPGGVLFSQDGHLPLVVAVFQDERFWVEEVGVSKPLIEGLGKERLIKIVKHH